MTTAKATSNGLRGMERARSAPATLPGNVAVAKAIPERRSIRPWRPYATAPLVAFAATTASDVAVSGGVASCTCNDPAYTGPTCHDCATGFQDNDHDGTCSKTFY